MGNLTAWQKKLLDRVGFLREEIHYFDNAAVNQYSGAPQDIVFNSEPFKRARRSRRLWRDSLAKQGIGIRQRQRILRDYYKKYQQTPFIFIQEEYDRAQRALTRIEFDNFVQRTLEIKTTLKGRYKRL